MAFVVAINDKPGLYDRLTDAAGLSGEPFTVINLNAVDASQPVDIVLLDAASPDPLEGARRAAADLPSAEIVFLVAEARLRRFRDGLPFVPGMASAWTLSDDAEPLAVAVVLQKAADIARQRRANTELRSRINRQLDVNSANARGSEAAAQRLRQLALSESYLATLLTQAPDAFVAVTLGGQVIAWNQAASDLFGVSPASAIGQPLKAVFPVQMAEALSTLINETETGKVSTRQQVQFEAGARPRWVELSFAPVRDEEETIASLSVTVRDVTERVQSDQALREREAQLVALNHDLERKVIERTQARGRTWQTTPDLMGALNSEGYFETSNPAWMTVLGWTEEEVAQHSIFELLHPDDVERTRVGFNLTQQGQPAIRFPNRYRCKDGGYRWISWVGVPEEGMVYCTGRDITEEKQAEEALAETQEQLRQAQKMEAVGQLTGGLAHDFNNLLAGISGSLELLEKRLGEGRLSGVERYINAAQGAARRAAALTHRLLAFSRRQTLDPRPTDVNKLIAGMEDLIRRSVGPDVEVEVVGAGGLWATKLDGPQLENALLNLCINARDAMSPQGGRLTIETANKWLDERASKDRDLPPGQYVSLCVTDTGSGMDRETVQRIFDPFFTTKPLGEGTGLGLSMVYGFVRQSGGQVRVYSELGDGTTMCLYLPRHLGQVEDLPTVELGDVEPGDGQTVLVIDDEPTIRMVIAEVLEESRYRVIEAGDGASGLAILESTARIDLLITDVGLPGGMNGRQVADAARALRPALKVLFVTGFAENAAVGNGHLEPGMEVITKPFPMAVLARKIRDLLE